MWEQIRSNQVRSIILVAGMCTLLLLIGYFFGLFFFQSPAAGLLIALIIWAVMSLIAFFQGDSILLSISGARRIGRDDYPRLYNIVEEMKIATGLPAMPAIYIIDDPALNAFATGRDPNKAAVAVTSGLIEKLNRDELQGVIGHEMSHIRNRDVLLMALSGILLGSIVILAWHASRFMFYGGMSGARGGRHSSSQGGDQVQILIVVLGVILMILAPILAQLIYFAISRRREYLADASSALYTRYPEGLASALEKIGASTGQLRTANRATAPMFIANPFRGMGREAADLTSTHPPIAERVRILRSMAGGASFTDYERAYRTLHRGKGVIPNAAVAGSSPVQLRKPEPGPLPQGMEQGQGRVKQKREVSDLMWQLSGYSVIDCACGTRLKLPPNYGRPEVRCPHCGRIHQVQRV